MDSESMSVVIITKNEESNIVDCLESLYKQNHNNYEVIIVDSKSTDKTIDLAKKTAKKYNQFNNLKIVEDDPKLFSFGRVRNIGVEQAKNSIIAFISADAYCKDNWLRLIQNNLNDADIVYGKQIHVPPVKNAISAIRSFRYYTYNKFNVKKEITDNELFLSSNVNCAVKRKVFDSVKYDEKLTGSEDYYFSKEAIGNGLKILYDPDMIVYHKDVTDFRREIYKNLREGISQGKIQKSNGIDMLLGSWITAMVILPIGIALFDIRLALPTFIFIMLIPSFRRYIEYMNYRSNEMPRYNILESLIAVVLGSFCDIFLVYGIIKGYIR